RTVLGQGVGNLASDIRFLHVTDTASGPGIFVVGGPLGGLTLLSLDQHGAATVDGQVTFNGAVAGNLGAGCAMIDLGGGDRMLVVGSTAQNGLLGYRIDSNGGFGAVMSMAVPGLHSTSVLAVSGSGHIYVSGADGTIGWFRGDA